MSSAHIPGVSWTCVYETDCFFVLDFMSRLATDRALPPEFFLDPSSHFRVFRRLQKHRLVEKMSALLLVRVVRALLHQTDAQQRDIAKLKSQVSALHTLLGQSRQTAVNAEARAEEFIYK